MTEKKQDVLLENHEYDGITEYDNPMPLWWVLLFWATIIFSIVYAYYFMLGTGKSHVEEYEQEIALAKETYGPSEEESLKTEQGPSLEELVASAKDPEAVSRGSQIFTEKCVACHAVGGIGIIGPNLTDSHWIHGGDLLSIYNVVKNGVPEKGMIPWGAQMDQKEMVEVVAFIRSIQDTNKPGKEPQGELFEATSLD